MLVECICNRSKSIDQLIGNENNNDMHLKFEHANYKVTIENSGCRMHDVYCITYSESKLIYSIANFFCLRNVFEFTWPCNKVKRNFLSHSTNSIYCELFIGKMLSTLTAAVATVTVTVQFMLCLVVDCFSFFFWNARVCKHFNGKEIKPRITEKWKCKNAEPFSHYFVTYFVSCFVLFFFRRNV